MTLGVALFLIMFGFLAFQTYGLVFGTHRIYVGSESRLFTKGEIITHTSGVRYEIRDIEGGYLIVRPVRGNHVEG